VAHIEVQRLIDWDQAPKVSPLTSSYALWVHKEFCQRLPEDLLWVENPITHEKIKVIAGQWRAHDVTVGQHEPPIHANLNNFLHRFDEAYNGPHLGLIQQILAIAAAHHRFLWIHPFLDGNGRVTRLMSYAALRYQGVGSPLWSVARGLARNVTSYKSMLVAADMPRQGDLDGRGTLSQKALISFCEFFLKACIDQIDFMQTLIQPDNFLRRLGVYIDDKVQAEELPKGSFAVLREVFLMGEMPRGKAPEVTGYKDRMARDVLARLLAQGLLVSETPKSPVRLAFPHDLVERVFPALYPE
jgi:Fic family protein